jgi:V8-like Glu-specific endopeptidase
MFERRAVKERRSMFWNAVTIASIDGRTEEGKMRSLAVIGKNQGLTNADMKTVLESPGKVKFMVPQDDQEKIKHVLTLVNLMVVDR